MGVRAVTAKQKYKAWEVAGGCRWLRVVAFRVEFEAFPVATDCRAFQPLAFHECSTVCRLIRTTPASETSLMPGESAGELGGMAS
jgi:hypothetical protein